jgi:hypothetical protein
MSTSRPFAYNTGSTITGTIQVGNLSIGTPTAGFAATGLQWWNGPDEDLGYVIAQSVPEGNQPTPFTGITAYVGFFRSSSLNESSFIEIAQRVSTNQTFASGNAASLWLTTNNYWSSWVYTYNAGLYKTTYAGYFADVVSFFATATPTTYGSNPATSVQTTSIVENGTDDGSDFSCQWIGYFKPTTSETYTFYTSSDDASYMWIGSNAQSGFTTTNATVKNGGLHGTVEQSGSIALTAGTYYPIRIQFGERGGGDVLTFNYSTPTISKTTNVTGLVFYNTTTNGF